MPDDSIERESARACTCWRNRYECPLHELVGWLDDKRTPYFSQPIMRDRQQPKEKP